MQYSCTSLMSGGQRRSIHTRAHILGNTTIDLGHNVALRTTSPDISSHDNVGEHAWIASHAWRQGIRGNRLRPHNWHNGSQHRPRARSSLATYPRSSASPPQGRMSGSMEEDPRGRYLCGNREKWHRGR